MLSSLSNVPPIKSLLIVSKLPADVAICIIHKHSLGMKHGRYDKPVEHFEGMAEYSVAGILSIAGVMLAMHGNIARPESLDWINLQESLSRSLGNRRALPLVGPSHLQRMRSPDLLGSLC